MQKNSKKTTTDILEKSQKIGNDWFAKSLPKRPEEKPQPHKSTDDIPPKEKNNTDYYSDKKSLFI